MPDHCRCSLRVSADAQCVLIPMQDQLNIDLKESKAALDEAQKQGAAELAAAELEVKRAQNAADAKIDEYKERVNKVQHWSCCELLSGAGTLITKEQADGLMYVPLFMQNINDARAAAKAEVDELQQKVCDVSKPSPASANWHACTCNNFDLPRRKSPVAVTKQVAAVEKASSDRVAELEAVHAAAIKALEVSIYAHESIRRLLCMLQSNRASFPGCLCLHGADAAALDTHRTAAAPRRSTCRRRRLKHVPPARRTSSPWRRHRRPPPPRPRRWATRPLR